MIDYRGPLDDRHVRAVARAALRARGFQVTPEALERHLAKQSAIGRRLRDEQLVAGFPAFIDLADYRANAHRDPYLWERVAMAAGFGYRMGAELDRLRAIAGADETIPVLSGAFNAAITVIDYVVDEVPGGVGLLDAIDDRSISVIFASESGASAMLGEAYRSQTSASGRLALALMSTTALGFWRLYPGRKAAPEWDALRRTIAQLRDVEARSTSPAPPSEASRADLEAKSALAVTVMMRLCALGVASAMSPELADAAVALGRLLSLTDDMADLRADMSRGVVSNAAIAVARMAAERGSRWPAASELYECLRDSAAELMSVLESPPLADAGTADPAVSAQKAMTPGERGPASLPSFARNVVADWLGWNFEELRPTDRPTLAGERLTAATRAIQTLLADQRDGYPDATHWLRFPRRTPDGVRYETHGAVLYHRALILDVLAQAYGVGLPVPRGVLDAEAITILSQKHYDLRGGWSYVPAVRELPPDADDLGIVLGALMRVGGRPLAAACDEPVRLALDAAGDSDGFPTWIVDPRGASLPDREAAEYINVIGGFGIHPDVVATLLSAMLAYDPSRFDSALVSGSAYLEGAQDASGAWTSKWYAGPYYATYHAVSVLQAVAPGSPCLSRAARFLLEGQGSSGAWGSGDGISISTAIAVTALAAFDRDDCRDAADRGIQSLMGRQLPDGSWPAASFIEFVTRDGIESYSSRVMTTALCLRALLSLATATTAERPPPQAAGRPS